MTDRIHKAEEAFRALISGITEESGEAEERETNRLADDLRRLYDDVGTPDADRIIR